MGSEVILIVVSSCVGAFIVWFSSVRGKSQSSSTSGGSVENSYEVVKLKVKIAKLEQQRNRRYKSQFEKSLFKQMKIDSNEQGVWDQTAITPGTNFMHKLNINIDNYFRGQEKKYGLEEIIFTGSEELLKLW